MSKIFQFPHRPIADTGQPIDFTGASADFPYLGIYTAETTQRFVPGTRYITWDGREYRYCLSTTAMNMSEACYFTGTGVLGYTACTATVAIGATSLVIPAGTHSALAEDELAGGFLNIFGSVADGADGTLRAIVGNEASAANAAVTVYLEFPLSVAVDASSAYEIFENPYRTMAHSTGGGDATLGKLGPAMAYVTATGYFFWAQSRGPYFVNPQDTVNGDGGLGVNWRSDGSLDGTESALGVTVPTPMSSQYAGYRMLGSQSGNGPVVMLLGG